VTFFLAVTIDWVIPRFMPGNPVQNMLARAAVRPEAAEVMYGYYTRAFGLDVPIWQQYLNFWNALFHGDLGTSVYLFPQPVAKVLRESIPYDIFLLLPAILLSWWAGNKFGAFAARTKRLDNTLLPIGYILTATPYMWLGILLAWAFGVVFDIFPIAGAYSFSMQPHLSWTFIGDVLKHWFLPFASLFLVGFGGWAIGMRNMIIYELEADYSHYLEALGAPRKLVRKYAFRNAILPQITGLALQLGVIVAGALVTEVVFSYPGIGYLLLAAIQNQDYFLIQGCFLFIITGVLLANFIIDIAYVIVDPRVRRGMVGE
jgi:peptide/nickel transport system permease protein